MYLSPFKIATAAAVVAVAMVGAAYFGRATAPGGVGGQPSPSPAGTPAATPDAVAIFESYRDARDQICDRYRSQTDPLRPQFEDLYDPGETAQERAPKVAALSAFALEYHRMVDELADVQAPAEIADDHAAIVAKYDAVAGLIDGIVARLNAGDLAGAEAIDNATNPIAEEIEQFESRNVLSGCP